MSELKKLPPELALMQFSSPDSSARERADALTALIAVKLLPKQAESEAIAAGRSYFLHAALHAPNASDRLLAIAESIRLAQVVKRWQADTARALEPAFSTELPPMQLLDNADDRLNLARACSAVNSPWMATYLAESIALEEQGEKARSEMVAGLLARQPNIADAVRLLASTFPKQRPTTENPGDTLARRITRTLAAFRSSIVEVEADSGDGLGEALLSLLHGSFVSVGRPIDEKAIADLSEEVLLTVHDILRTKISVITDPAMYQSVAYCRKLLGGKFWPESLRKPLSRLVIDVSEALVLLGRQGTIDQTLLGQLDVLCNVSERARAIARGISERHPELPETVRDWLNTGKVQELRTASEAAAEAAAGNADATIGLALQSARNARQASDVIRENLLSNLEIYEPNLVAVTADCFDRFQILYVYVEQAAGLRRLELYGLPGEEIDFSSKFFNVVGGNPRQRMVIRQPAVVKTRDNGVVGDVVLKGLVE